jgi:hypothetical protein
MKNFFSTYSGFLLKKYLDQADLVLNTQSELGFMLIRYAEVLLTYAEAKVELNQIDASVLNLDAYNYAWIENTKTGVKYDLNSAIAIEGQAQTTNKDYVLRLSKTKQNSSISETILESDLVIFSTENTINFKSTNSDYDLKEVLIYDMTGKLMQIQTGLYVSPASMANMDVTNLPAGVYIVQATDQQGRVISKKLIK